MLFDGKDKDDFARNHLLLVVSVIIFTEVCERCAFYGLSVSLQLFFKTVLNESTAAASVNVSTFMGTCYCTPLFGGWLADAYLNRYYTIIILICIYFIGMASISFTSWRLVNSDVSHKLYENIFWIGLYMVALGTGTLDTIYLIFTRNDFNTLIYYIFLHFKFCLNKTQKNKNQRMS